MERLAIAAICFGSVAASFAGMLAILRYADQEQAPQLTYAPTEPVPAPRPADRESWLRSRSVILDPPPSPAEQTAVAALPPSDETENPDTWSAETHAETQPAPGWGTRLSIFPPQRAPSAPPGMSPAAKSGPQKSYSLSEKLAEISPGATQRLTAKFATAKVAWPPAEMALVAIKDEKIVELHARQPGAEWKLVHRYPVLAASGRSGPKLRQGDRQVPEGIYGISFLNPNSRYHVSMRVNYPNAFDREMAAKEGRSDLGGDIMIHGKALSVGCLAVGDAAAEELFVLAAQVGLPSIKLIIAPTDFRRGGVPTADQSQPAWVPKLYTEVAAAMTDYKRPPSAFGGLLSFFGN